MKRVLNVGGNSRKIGLPTHFADFEHLLLDIDPGGQPDIVCDARELEQLECGTFEAIYCSHNLEHYYAHDAPRVLRGFASKLKPGGFADIRVPDIQAVMKRVVEKDLDIEDVLYKSAAGDIKVHDVLYGYGKEMATSGNEYFAHKMGFSAKSLNALLGNCGFKYCFTSTANLEVKTLAFVTKPTKENLELLGLSKIFEAYQQQG